MTTSARLTHWPGPEIPTETAIRRVLEAEGLAYGRWSNKPLDVYFAHSHTYNKVIYVIAGGITFTMPNDGTSFTMKIGDRLDLPAGVIHEAVISTLGVECFEAHF